MSRSKKQQYTKKLYESDCSRSDTFSAIYMSMMMSPAWKDLSAQQKVLYLACKAQVYAEKQKPDGNDLQFTMNQSKWCNLYHLYEKSNAKGFYRDMTALIEHGFIVCVQCGAITRTKSVYQFSSKWLKYGTEAFDILPSEMTTAMQRQQRKEQQKTAPYG